jgi:hypothetical protein
VSKFVEALAGRLAEKWLSMLAVPGAVFVVAAFLAVRAGHSLRPVRVPEVSLWLVVAFLAASAAAGLLVQGLGAAVVRLWLAAPFDPVTRRVHRRRRAAWDRASAAFEDALIAAGQARTGANPAAGDPIALRSVAVARNAERNRVALVAPSRTFWIGDRVAAVDQRVHERYRLDLTSAWPRLWLVMPEPGRAEYTAARAALTRAGCLVGWGVLYAILGTLAWPALPVGAVCVVTGWIRGRTAADVLADLVEAGVDVHGRALAAALGLDCPGPLTTEVGAGITAALRKGA